MSLSLSISPADIRKVQQRLREYADDRERELERVIAKYTTLIHAEAIRNAPVNKKIGIGGNLRQLIRYELAGLAGHVISGADYSRFVEFGTGRRGAASGVDTPPGYNHGPKPGAAAQPFLFPAIEKYRSDFLRAVAKVFGK